MSHFTRCQSTRPDGARCWLVPGHEGKHLVLKPGEVPSADAIGRVAKARPDLDYGAVCMMAALEPVGGLKNAERALHGDRLPRFRGPEDFLDWNRRESEREGAASPKPSQAGPSMKDPTTWLRTKPGEA